MIFVDANILLYAEDESSPRHAVAKAWWDAQLSGREPVGLCWPVLNAFLRISTNHRVYAQPLTVHEAADRVSSWFRQPCAMLVQPTPDHWTRFARLLVDSQASANLVSDAHLAALAIDHAATLFSSDADFARFPGLKWKNPLV